MHYCFLTFGSWQGNAGLIRPRHLGAELIERGCRVSYIIDDLPHNYDLPLHPNAYVEYVAKPRSAGQILARRRAIRRLRPDFVHVLNPHVKSFLALAGMRGVKVVADWDEPPIVKDLGLFRGRAEAALDRWLRRRATVRIACTSFLQQHLRDRFGMETVYIPHAPYLSNHRDGISPFSAPTAVYMGNLYPLWDQDILFESARLLREQGLAPPILVMGDGPEMQKWKQFIAGHNLGNVTLAGFVRGEELWLRLRHAHVLLFPIRDTIVNRSRCPSKVFAYAQARRPIITSRVGELPYMLGEDKPIWIEPTPQALARTLADVMARPRPADVDYELDKHSWGERADRLLDALRG